MPSTGLAQAAHLCLLPPPQALVLREWAEALGVPRAPLLWSCLCLQQWQPTVGAEPGLPQVCLPACPLGASCLESWAEARAISPTELYPVPVPGHQEQACMQEHGSSGPSWTCLVTAPSFHTSVSSPALWPWPWFDHQVGSWPPGTCLTRPGLAQEGLGSVGCFWAQLSPSSPDPQVGLQWAPRTQGLALAPRKQPQGCAQVCFPGGMCGPAAFGARSRASAQHCSRTHPWTLEWAAALAILARLSPRLAGHVTSGFL